MIPTVSTIIHSHYELEGKTAYVSNFKALAYITLAFMAEHIIKHILHIIKKLIKTLILGFQIIK